MVRMREGGHPMGNAMVHRGCHQVHIQRSRSSIDNVKHRLRESPLHVEGFLSVEGVGYDIEGRRDPQNLETQVPGVEFQKKGYQLLIQGQRPCTACHQGIADRLIVREDAER